MSLKITESENTLESYKEIHSEEAKTEIENDSNCIFVTPLSGFRDNKDWLYTAETSDFVKFVNSEYEVKAIYLSTPDKILSLNSIDAYLPLMTVGFHFVQNLGISLIIDIIREYLQVKYPRIFQNPNNKANFTLQIEKSDKKRTLNIEYDGPANKISEVFNKEKISEITEKL